MSSRGRECAFAREGADVQLVDDLPLERSALPVVVRPKEPRRVYDLRRLVRPFGLKARGGGWVEIVVAVEPEAVARALLQTFGKAVEVAALLLCERKRRGRTIPFKDDLDPAPARCPHAEMYAAPGQHLGPDGQSSRQLRRFPQLNNFRSIDFLLQF